MIPIACWEGVHLQTIYDSEVMLGKKPLKYIGYQFSPDFWLVYNLVIITDRNRDLILEQWRKKNQQLREGQRTNYIGLVRRNSLILASRGLLFKNFFQDLIQLCEDRYDEMAFICPEVADQIRGKYLEYKWLKICPKPNFSMLDC